jgi:putative ABC transport system permease protein
MLQIELLDGTIHELPVAGSYQTNYTTASFRQRNGLLLPLELSLELAAADAFSVYLDVHPASLEAAAQQASVFLPEAVVINMADYTARFSQTYRNLFIFAVSLAGLALAAGALLVANSISLAVMERQYELGIMKAVGYSGRDILKSLLFEYLYGSLLAIGFGLLAVYLVLAAVGILNDSAAKMLYLEPYMAAAIAIVSGGLVFLTVTALIWRPSQVSPLVVLVQRG